MASDEAELRRVDTDWPPSYMITATQREEIAARLPAEVPQAALSASHRGKACIGLQSDANDHRNV